jgi:hypothetical protein
MESEDRAAVARWEHRVSIPTRRRPPLTKKPTPQSVAEESSARRTTQAPARRPRNPPPRKTPIAEKDRRLNAIPRTGHASWLRGALPSDLLQLGPIFLVGSMPSSSAIRWTLFSIRSMSSASTWNSECFAPSNRIPWTISCNHSLCQFSKVLARNCVMKSDHMNGPFWVCCSVRNPELSEGLSNPGAGEQDQKVRRPHPNGGSASGAALPDCRGRGHETPMLAGVAEQVDAT